ncbi:MAG: hypothetical protein IPK19_21650 [Chloroflexi bacterium]|nr:hypothetical protein [Chloroflexota bacterium]
MQTLLMGRASYEALREHAPHAKPFVLSRAGVPGIQRYAQTWSGDNYTSWETLRWNLPMGLGLGLSGVPNTGHDIGGFFGPAPDPELFVRWVQVGVFFPRFAIHSWNTDGTVNEPWMHPEVLPLIREAIKFRYRLKPHLAALMREAHETGHPIMRPLVYHYADDPRCRGESFDFMVGADLLIAPVLEPGMTSLSGVSPHRPAWLDVGGLFTRTRRLKAGRRSLWQRRWIASRSSSGPELPSPLWMAILSSIASTTAFRGRTLRSTTHVRTDAQPSA